MRTSSVLSSFAVCALVLGSCQKLDLCERGRCNAAGGGVGGGADTRAGAGGDAAGAPHDAGGAVGDAGAAAGAGGADAGADSGPEPLACEPGRSDCDGSRLTGCETDVAWSVRHCGGCRRDCDDACQNGTCLETLLIERNAGVNAFASTGTYAFAKLVKLDATSAFARIRIETGAIDELIPQLGDDDVQLAIGDRVYLLDTAEVTLRSFSVEGTDLEVEPTIAPRSVGAYPGGTYYLSRVEAADDTGATDTLYFRPNFASEWQAIRQREATDTTALWSSSSHGVVYVEPDSSGTNQLYLLQGPELVPQGPLPANAIQALPIGEGITVLTHDEYAPLNELWWFEGGDEPIHYAVSPDGLRPQMRAYRDIVVLLLTQGNHGYVERFNKKGAIGGRIGVRLGSDLLGLDDEYLFHALADDWFHWRVLRTSWGILGP